MPIIYPPNCRNITQGALRELRKKGSTTASGGLWTNERANSIGVQATNYFLHDQPARIFMDSLERTKQQIDENTQAICSASHKLVDAANDANKQLATVTGKFRDGIERLGTALDKLAKTTERTDFIHTTQAMASLVDSLERLAVLEERGLLSKVMCAVSGKNN